MCRTCIEHVAEEMQSVCDVDVNVVANKLKYSFGKQKENLVLEALFCVSLYPSTVENDILGEVCQARGGGARPFFQKLS